MRLAEMNMCRRCKSGKHTECNGLILKREKKKFFKGYNEIETSNVCHCSCNKITNEDTSVFREKLGPDIRNPQRG